MLASPAVADSPVCDRRTDAAAVHAADLFSSRVVGDVLVLAAEPSLVVGNRQRLKQRVLDELAAEVPRRNFVIDFTTCGYVDNTGLGVLISISKRIREANGRLVLAGINEDLATLFALTKLDALFSVASTVERAVECIGVCSP